MILTIVICDDRVFGPCSIYYIYFKNRIYLYIVEQIYLDDCAMNIF